ncbi:MAG: AAA family ATPase [Bacilli bacterium]
MHKLSKLQIKNFKSIKNSEFFLSNFTPIIGYNNAGKSNVLEAILWLMNKSVLPEYFFNDLTKEIEISGEITGITKSILESLGSHKSSIEKYIYNGEIKIKRIHPVSPIKLADIKLYVYDRAKEEWTLNPSGIDGALKKLYPEPIVIKAMDNTEDDIGKFKSTSTIGKLIGEIIKPIEEKYSENIATCMDSIDKLLSVNGDNRVEELNQFDDSLNDKLNEIFPDLKLKLDISTPRISDIFKSGTLKILEVGSVSERGVENFGTGAKRTIQMTLIRQLAEVKKNQDTNSTTLLLIDEPELYLHPQAIEQLRVSLKQLSENGYQIVFTTHSGQMVSSNDIKNTIILKKCLMNGTQPRKTLYESVESIEINHENQLELLFNLSNSNDILFSEKIILAEGKTEKKLLPFLYERTNENRTFLLDKISIISQGGVTNTLKTQKVLEVMGLDAKAIVDLDFVFTHGIKSGCLDTEDEDIKKCKDIMKRLDQEGKLKINETTKLPQKWNDKKAEFYYSVLAKDSEAEHCIKNLHEKMKSNKIWLWTTGAIETQLELNSKTEKEWATFKENIMKQTNDEIKTKYPTLVELFNWIKQ